MTQLELDALVEVCRQFIKERFGGAGDHGAAAMLLHDGTVLTGTAPEEANPAVQVCHETEPYCAAFRLERRVKASVCLHLRTDGEIVVLSPCGVCRERLANFGPNVLVAVPTSSGVDGIAWKSLGELLPDYWLASFPDEVVAEWLA